MEPRHGKKFLQADNGHVGAFLQPSSDADDGVPAGGGFCDGPTDGCGVTAAPP
jgi:hypothetical protein